MIFKGGDSKGTLMEAELSHFTQNVDTSRLVINQLFLLQYPEQPVSKIYKDIFKNTKSVK